MAGRTVRLGLCLGLVALAGAVLAAQPATAAQDVGPTLSGSVDGGIAWQTQALACLPVPGAVQAMLHREQICAG